MIDYKDVDHKQFFCNSKLTDKDASTDVVEDHKVPNTEADVLLAKGNVTLLPVFKSSLNDDANKSDESSARPTENSSGMVMVKGTLVNVEKLMERIKTAERALLDTEQVLVDVKRENAELLAANAKATGRVKDLSADLKSATRRLGDADSSAHSLQRKNAEFLSVLTAIHEKIAPIVVVKKERGSSR